MWVSVLVLVLAAPSVVSAKREVTFNYPYSRVWTSAVRLMRVDFEAEITEKDRDDGYFLFEYPDRGKKVSGSMELIAIKQGEGDAVRVVLQIPALPTYVETMIVDRLSRKLEQEFGAPKQAKPPADSPAGAGKDRGKDNDDPDSPADADKPKGNAPKSKPSDKPQQAGNND
jgi:hypothetical protein